MKFLREWEWGGEMCESEKRIEVRSGEGCAADLAWLDGAGATLWKKVNRLQCLKNKSQMHQIPSLLCFRGKTSQMVLTYISAFSASAPSLSTHIDNKPLLLPH